jgi:hypothetical protein
MNVSRHKPHVPDLVPTWAPATGQTDWAHGALWPGKGPAYLQEPLGRHEFLVSLSLAESTLQPPGEKLTERVPPSLDAEHSAPYSEARCLILLVTQTGRRPRSHPRASEGLIGGALGVGCAKMHLVQSLQGSCLCLGHNSTHPSLRSKECRHNYFFV